MVSMVLVSLPVHIISKPVANGSNVPAWPTFNFFTFMVPRILFTTSKEVQVKGLFTSNISPSAKLKGLVILIIVNG